MHACILQMPPLNSNNTVSACLTCAYTHVRTQRQNHRGCRMEGCAGCGEQRTAMALSVVFAASFRALLKFSNANIFAYSGGRSSLGSHALVLKLFNPRNFLKRSCIENSIQSGAFTLKNAASVQLLHLFSASRHTALRTRFDPPVAAQDAPTFTEVSLCIGTTLFGGTKPTGCCDCSCP
jgi:hypothetical protein